MTSNRYVIRYLNSSVRNFRSISFPEAIVANGESEITDFPGEDWVFFRHFRQLKCC